MYSHDLVDVYGLRRKVQQRQRESRFHGVFLFEIEVFIFDAVVRRKFFDHDFIAESDSVLRGFVYPHCRARVLQPWFSSTPALGS
jgi:hypothetical protein